jgi:hypothetical protein
MQERRTEALHVPPDPDGCDADTAIHRLPNELLSETSGLATENMSRRIIA